MKRMPLLAVACIFGMHVLGYSENRANKLLDLFDGNDNKLAETNGSLRISTVDYNGHRIRCERNAGNPNMVTVRDIRPDGGMDVFEFNGKDLMSSFLSSSNRTDGVMSIFIPNADSNGVARIDAVIAGGKIASPIRSYGYDGREMTIPVFQGKRAVDKEYIPPKGASVRIGDLVWSVVNDKHEETLSINGRTLLCGKFSLCGRYPWLMGSASLLLPSRDIDKLKSLGLTVKPWDRHIPFSFAINLQDLRVNYFRRDEGESEAEKRGLSYEWRSRKNFWRYALSNHANEYCEQLAKALKPTPSDAPEGECGAGGLSAHDNGQAE